MIHDRGPELGSATALVDQFLALGVVGVIVVLHNGLTLEAIARSCCGHSFGDLERLAEDHSPVF